VSEIKKRLKQLRDLMAKAKIDAYYIPSTDPHQSEYVPECWQRRRWISGFTGSAGDLVITARTAGLWTDGRYFLQAEQQLKGTGIRLFKMGNKGVPTVPQWVGRTLKPGQVLGADPRVLSLPVLGQLQGAAKVKLIDGNLVDKIWDDQPTPSKAPIEVLPSRLAGLTPARKLAKVKREMKERNADALVMVALDAIAWQFNVRSTDVDHNPVAISYAIIKDGKGHLYTDLDKITPAALKALGKSVEVHPYAEVGKALRELGKAKARVWVDGATANAWVTRKLKGATVIGAPNPVFTLKAAKNDTEVQGMRDAHVRDGVAMVRFLYWLQGAVRKGGITEVTVEEKLLELRARGEHFRDTSFGTIAGYNDHGAIIHYEATQETAYTLGPRGILLVDSGGQYLDGTTDITRTLLLGGKATPEQKDRYTRVLKGHINLASLSFPAGWSGRSLESVARLSLWEAGLNYNHGTGHGVGHYLNVHEGPQSFHILRCNGTALAPGNMLTIEPGHYEEGGFGIRIENLYLVKWDEERGNEDAPFLKMEALTLCPIDTKLIDRRLLTKDDKVWLNAYHAKVQETLTPLLDEEEAAWLAKACKAI